MVIRLELPAETEARLIAQAENQGVSVDRYIESLIERHLTSQAEPDWKKLLDQFVSNPALAEVPPSSDEAIDRENIDREREDSQLSSKIEPSPQERAEQFVQWARSHSVKAPLLSDEAISRESIYREREDQQL